MRAFYNVCQHRGNRLRACGVGTSGASLTFKCPYHHWEYELDGAYQPHSRSRHVPAGAPPRGLREVRVRHLGRLRLVHA